MTEHEFAARLEALECRVAIERLIFEYAHAFDSRDEPLLRSLWHDGARLSLGEPFGDFHGVDAIVESARQNWMQMPHMHHWMANVIIEINGDHASSRSAVDVLCTHVKLGPIQISGAYRDRFECRGGRWAMIERLFELHFLTPLTNWSPVAGLETKADAPKLKDQPV